MQFESAVRKYNTKPNLTVVKGGKNNISFEQYSLNKTKSKKNKSYIGMISAVLSVIIAGATFFIYKDSLATLLKNDNISSKEINSQIIEYQEDIELESKTEVLDLGEIIFVEPSDTSLIIEEEILEDNSSEIVYEEEIEEIDPLYFDLSDIEKDTSFKAYMDYRTITNTSSMQFQLQQGATTDELGFRRYGEDLMVAVGTRFASECGVRLEITLDSGIVFTAIVGDIKQDIHTDATNTYRETSAGANVVEFIIDKEVMDPSILNLGSVSNLGLQGNVVSIRVLTNDLEQVQGLS